MKVLKELVIDRLNRISDLETDRSLRELNIVLDVQVDKDGTVKIVFRPNSPFCPYAVNLGLDIKNAAIDVEGVKKVIVECQGHMMDELVNRLVNRE